LSPSLFFSSTLLRPPTSTLFPYTTLFRSARRHLRARHGRAACGHPLSRRLRGALESGGHRAREDAGRDPVHRRDPHGDRRRRHLDRKSTRLNSSHSQISYAVFCLKKKKKK